MSNVIEAQTPKKAALPRILEASQISPDFLRDESRMEGKAGYAAFPISTDEVSALMAWAKERSLPVTVSGGRTGIAGGAVPDGGLLLSLTRLQKIGAVQQDSDGRPYVFSGAGVLLSELQNHLITKKSGLFFPPDPTETSATIGGMIACNASGAHTYSYGPTRKYVKSITAVLPDGDIVRLQRGQAVAGPDGSFVLKKADGAELRGKVPLYPQPETKNAAGYFSGSGMDLVDLFIGSEGTLGVVAEAELYLLPNPEIQFNAMFFLSSEAAAIELTESLRRLSSIEVTAIEYFDPLSLELLRGRRQSMKAASMVPPGMPQGKAVAGLFVDVTSKKADVSAAAEALREAGASLSKGRAVAVWAAFDKDERERLRKFRHALPETVNSLIAERRKSHPQITKLGTDMAVPDRFLSEIMSVYRRELDANRLDYVIFGHIGNNHLHVNILPRNPDEYALGKRLYAGFAKDVLSMKGSVSAEHGVGKLKRNFLQLMLGDEGLDQMRRVKAVFDPEMRLGPGTLF